MSLCKLFVNLLMVVFLSFSLKAQVYKAGDMFSGYVDIVPDTLINGAYSANEIFYFDINNDQVNDYLIKAFSFNSLGGGTNYISIEPISSNSFIRYGRNDSIYHNYYHYWMYSEMALPLLFGDSINSITANWQSKVLYLTNTSGSAGTYLHPSDWIGINDLYIGLRYQIATDTIYGWIRVNCPSSNKCYIKDYSSSGFVNGLNEIMIKEKNVIIYPNPVSSTINIYNKKSTFVNADIEIVNSLGQNVLRQPYSENIDVSWLHQGLYILKVYTEKSGMYYSKFLKE